LGDGAASLIDASVNKQVILVPEPVIDAIDARDPAPSTGVFEYLRSYAAG
jgi:hypothetical protein